MNISFLEKKDDCNRLILVFPGWSCGKELYQDFRLKGWDVAVVEKYEIPLLDKAEMEQYSTICLFAWSLGVFMAELSGISDIVTSAFALNGTLKPADDLEGIPLHIFSTTAEKLSPISLKKFRRRMAGNADLYNLLFNREFSNAETDILKSQLYLILELQSRSGSTGLPWKKVFISEHDTIFPAENMKRHWEHYKTSLDSNLEIIPLDEGHYVRLQQIAGYCIPDPEKVSQRFSAASSTYENNAIAQKELARLLTSHLMEAGVRSGKKILEIGCGTGLFTREIISNFTPSGLDLIDISDARPDIKEIPSRFFCKDAEEWIASSEAGVYDAVLSSSVVQWFINLPLFISNVFLHLKEDGIFGFSTFLPGNLEELDTLRPSPIHYHSKEEIIDFLSPFFEDIRVKEKTITLYFDSPSQLFNHLRATGVGGSAPSGKIPHSKLKKLKTLTFRSAIFSGRKRTKQEV